MNNKQIAINWANKTVKGATGFVYSDSFFKPFNSQYTRNKIINELASKGVVVWSDTNGGAFLFKNGDTRLSINNNGQHKVGIWCENNNLLVLPAIPV